MCSSEVLNKVGYYLRYWTIDDMLYLLLTYQKYSVLNKVGVVSSLVLDKAVVSALFKRRENNNPQLVDAMKDETRDEQQRHHKLCIPQEVSRHEPLLRSGPRGDDV